MAEWRLKVDGNEYAFDVKMLTPEALKHVKQWYGKELGRYNNFIEAFFEGDPDAAVCAIWIARRAAGETGVPEPMQMDGSFTLTQWLDTSGVDEEVEEDPNPTGATAPPTPASTETSTSSGENTDGPSPQPSGGSSETSNDSGGSTS
jgi:hypothetical protein